MTLLVILVLTNQVHTYFCLINTTNLQLLFKDAGAGRFGLTCVFASGNNTQLQPVGVNLCKD